MESYRGQEEFEEQLLRDVKTFVTKNFKEAQLRQKEELDDTFDKIFFRTLKTHRLLVEISEITGIKGENVEIIARSIMRFAYRIQNNDVQNIGKQNSRLRSWLHQAQQKNPTQDTTLNAEIDSESKHQSKTSKNKEKSKKKKNVKKIKNRLVQEIVLPTKADQVPGQEAQGTRSRDMLFYDIPVRYSETEVCNAIKQLGTVHRITIKKHYKYQSVKAEISLLEEYEESFVKGVWKEKILIGSNDKNKKVIDVRWFHGDKTVKDIKEKCKCKAYKVIQTNYYQDIARNNFTFEFGKTACFGNKTVFLAYFKNKEQLEAAIAMDKSMDNKWVIHGRRNESMAKIASREVTVRSLISTSLGKNNKVISINNHGSTSATPNTVIHTTTEEVVDTVNKYRKNLLDEPETQIQPSVTPTTKGYTSPENVVKIIEEYRGEVFIEHKIAPTQEGILPDLLDKNIEIQKRKEALILEHRRYAQRMEEKRKICKEKPISKVVTPVELHEFAKVNADCTERLQKESDRPYTLSNNNPFLKDKEDKSPLSESSDDDECLKDVKKRIKKKQGARSSDSEDDSTIDSSSEVEKKMELQPENTPDTDKINKTPLEGLSRVVKKGRSSRIKK
ncbi:uncharacterized protein OCT59_023753 [Rhizophagus irregularis]|uniref:Uncharacterized protein n=2 Tax=Rhizophagus irregularis TaxID=588596 RepID=A0A015L1U3_RHIIW|nr:hypothetical protein GLOIN_2v1845870 [Rhizophagus irregularis DAOM 181602=DAOM 197198]EXX73764.1 hypothetical protein RirG_057420 [Rhizophagus irregularis DAOM 197198w]POG63510.1 hypothetical protein GLOIN_2v1845870 [Rhizophagus irregularis DAOM 181602=DAOM 197198]UZO03346.1 hypothetical protein OCT59_023753 [Rhizophagus irregularis]GBC20751.1 hypothetical protein GLOIN_2v1845870 [Rhizophagus irregularis DAOM 181602=DAOM 197198]|eukprot:XP_025170376.1 hypothetical protein GLOIN_2v1845870 [Rhizophagus irregularis DAOM 181602=DAOM 197198]